jgi:hypothetical protein
MAVSGTMMGREGFGSRPAHSTSRPAVSARVVGREQLIGTLKALGGPLTRSWLRRGMRKAGARLADLARTELRILGAVETGSLLKAIGFKVFTSKRKNVGAVIGPRRDAKGKPARFRRLIVKGRRGNRIATKRERAEFAAGRLAGYRSDYPYRNPVKYAHLVEYGHRVVHGGELGRTVGRRFLQRIGFAKGGQVTGHVAAKPFMRRAWQIGRHEAMAIVEAELRQGLATETARKGAPTVEPSDHEEVLN